ncbi:DUF6875 domain-containing protein [aff. Roholtiella sp. LEGE 12411]|uniref:DUF6875 domain-containing protein n=1 Tax=aff. Roholtiella sp. LEGE 12411 TaxID=1828822 RepID=UPI001882978B|nr:hypothetical protein [aff. Roholtiella sp. LEGE 12411]MBE9033652.1 hypothetical protein [aff. Roholtiella sp. LEGE 12411]
MQLYTSIEIEQIQKDISYLSEIMEWVKSFLGRHHPDLGRPGPVCPFVPYALKSNNIQMAVIRTNNLDSQQLEDIVKRYRDIFLEIASQDKGLAIYMAFLLIFPDIQIQETSKLIDGIQEKLKPLFVESGLMIGEFHKRNESSGLHNPNFRPLRSPVPLLAIRFMVESDLPFLQSPDSPHLRIRYLEAYLKHFAHQHIDKTKLNEVYQALTLAKEQVKEETLVKY